MFDLKVETLLGNAGPGANQAAAPCSEIDAATANASLSIAASCEESGLVMRSIVPAIGRHAWMLQPDITSGRNVRQIFACHQVA